MIIFFDLDGPILDVSGKYYHLYRTIVSKFGGQQLLKEEYWELKRQRVPETEILRRSGLTGEETDFTALRRSCIEQRESLCHDRVWPEAATALRRLHGALPLVLVTFRHDPDTLAWQLDQLQLRSFFSRILSRPALEGADNQAGIKASLVKRVLGQGPFEGWFVGDTGTDILAGQELGVRTAAITFGIRPAEQLVTFAPDRVLTTPGELNEWAREILASNAKG